MEMREKLKPCCHTLFEVKQTLNKLLLANAGNNEENNCKPDHNRSELLCHWLVKDKLSKKKFHISNKRDQSCTFLFFSFLQT
jgi:hypothetical protein